MMKLILPLCYKVRHVSDKETQYGQRIKKYMELIPESMLETKIYSSIVESMV